MKFIKKVIIDNFQSHQHTEMDFESGLNIIVGQSDKGKSAVIRALKWVLYNEPRGADFVRYGTNECSVTIVTGDDFVITRRRKSNKNIYTIITPLGEKQEFENFGNDVPVEVYEATGMKKIRLDTDIESRLNLNEQLDPPFLLSESGTVRAKAIGRIVNTNILDAAERDIQKDILNNNVILKGYEKQLSDIDQELSQFSDIHEQEKNIEKIEKLFKTVTDIKLKIDQVNQFKERLTAIKSDIDADNQVLMKLKSLSEVIEKYSGLKENFSLYNQIYGYKNKLNVINEEYKKDCIVLDNLKTLETLESHVAEFENNERLFKKLFLLKEKFTKLSLEISNTKNIIETYKETATVEKNMKLLESHSVLYNKLIDLCQKQKDNNASIAKGSMYMEQLKKEFNVKINEYSGKLKQIGKCPTCYCQIDDSTVNHIICELEGELNGNN